jgi:putative membrane protein
MDTVLLVTACVFLGIAAAVHVFIFYLESIAWSAPATWRRFGLRSQAEADTVKPMAYNQGYYNAFLAVGAVLGLVFLATPGLQQAGFALGIFAAMSMVGAATVLVTSSPKLAGAALVQGVVPLVAAVLLVWALLA